MFAHVRSRHSNMSQAVDLTSYNDKHVCAIQFKRHKLVLCVIRCGRHVAEGAVVFVYGKSRAGLHCSNESLTPKRYHMKHVDFDEGASIYV